MLTFEFVSVTNVFAANVDHERPAHWHNTPLLLVQSDNDLHSLHCSFFSQYIFSNYNTPLYVLYCQN